MAARDAVSSEAIVRAIKAQIVVEKGVQDPSLLVPLSVAADLPRQDGCNWKVQVDGVDVAQDCMASVLAAATRLAGSLRLHR